MICRVESSASTSKTRSTIRGRKRSQWTAEALLLCSPCVVCITAGTSPILKQSAAAAALIKNHTINASNAKALIGRQEKKEEGKGTSCLVLSWAVKISEKLAKLSGGRERERISQFSNRLQPGLTTAKIQQNIFWWQIYVNVDLITLIPFRPNVACPSPADASHSPPLVFDFPLLHWDPPN